MKTTINNSLNRRLRVLIVDDSIADAALQVHALRSAGYQVEYDLVYTAPAMCAALEREDWDLITSDYHMPQFSAPEAVELAKKLRPNIPVIIVSGENDPDVAVSLKDAGAHDYVPKEELARLVTAVHTVLPDNSGPREQQSPQSDA